MAAVTGIQIIGFDVASFWTANSTGVSDLALEGLQSSSGNPLIGHEEQVYSTLAFTFNGIRYNYIGQWTYVADRGLIDGSASISGAYNEVSLSNQDGQFADLSGVSFAVNLGTVNDSTAEVALGDILPQLFEDAPGSAVANLHYDATPNVAAAAFAGDDGMTGGAGGDVLRGFDSNDVLDGRGGNDVLVGGNGDDRFVYGSAGGADVVQDFQPGASSGDTIDLSAFGTFPTLMDIFAISTQNGPDTVINFGGGNSLTLVNVQKLMLAPDDFVGVTSGPIRPLDILWNDTATDHTHAWQVASGAVGADFDLEARPPNWKILADGDFNGDGGSDIIWQNTSTGELRDWQMSNASLTSNLSIGVLPADYQLVATSDFNGDGNDDILVRSIAGDELRIWNMAGGAINGSTLLPNPPSTWEVQGAGDFNGDGSSDILWRNLDTGEIREWDISSAGLIGNTIFGNASDDYHIAATGDFNGDGNSDILWKNASTGEIREWLMGSNAILENFVFGEAPTAYKIIGAGDHDQDGTDDVLFRNDVTDEIREWLLSDGRVTSNFVLGSVPSSWDVAVHPATHSGDGLLLA